VTAQCRRGELSQQLGRAPNASEIAEHLCIDREWVIEATIAGANYSTLSTDRQPGPDDEFQSIGDTLGDVDPGLDKVLDVATARPLIAALPEQQRTVLTLRFFEDMTQSQSPSAWDIRRCTSRGYSPRRWTHYASILRFRDWRNPVGAAVPSGHFATGVECE
jgi:hypothetical protein